MSRASARWKRRLGRGLALLAFGLIPAGLCQFLAQTPQARHIHIEAFRYGKEPSVIRCNRGDRLHLTFSTRDTAHSFFLEEFDVDAKISPANRNVQLFLASRPELPPKITPEVVIVAEPPGRLSCLVSKCQYRCHVWCGPMHAFEHGNLIIWPNTLLFAGLGLLAGIPIVGLFSLRRDLRKASVTPAPVSPTDGWDIFSRLPWLKRLVRMREFQLVWIVITLSALYLVILTSLFGTKMSGRNFGVMVTWVVWMFLLTAVLTPLGGRIWCLACPLPVMGEALQRMAIFGVRTGATRLSSGNSKNRFFGLNLFWPRWLANDWPRVIIFLILGTFSTALVAVPRFTGWIVLGLVVLATLTALVWELRAFCRYLCPVTAFLGLYSKSAKLALRATNLEVCAKCTFQSCLRGSEKGWACPYGLCMAEVNENNDCGMCGECLKTCPYDNITLRWRPFALERSVRSNGEAWLAMGMLVLASAYCLVHLGHWPALRDCVNILDKGNWGLFALYGVVLWSIALIGMPAVMLSAAAAGKRLSGLAGPTWPVMTAGTAALVPIGLMLWIAFVVPMLLVNVSFVCQSLSDPFGWGWDLLGTANMPWHQVWPSAIPWIQVACVLAGLGYSLRCAWRIWLDKIGQPRYALYGMLPLSVFLIAFSGFFVCFFAN